MFITEDVFEHVRYPDRAWREIARVLRPGGVLIFTVPFQFDSPTLERVSPREDGADEYLVEEEWHYDGAERVLAYRNFGYDLFDRLSEFGFSTSVLLSTMQDRRRGIVDSYVFRAKLRGPA